MNGRSFLASNDSSVSSSDPASVRAIACAATPHELRTSATIARPATLRDPEERRPILWNSRINTKRPQERRPSSPARRHSADALFLFFSWSTFQRRREKLGRLGGLFLVRASFVCLLGAWHRSEVVAALSAANLTSLFSHAFRCLFILQKLARTRARRSRQRLHDSSIYVFPLVALMIRVEHKCIFITPSDSFSRSFN